MDLHPSISYDAARSMLFLPDQSVFKRGIRDANVVEARK